MTRNLKLSVVMILGAAAMLMLAGGGPDKAQAAPQNCSSYELVYNGKIGKQTLPKGFYAVALVDNERITCDYAQENFQTFLQNFYGKLTKPWVMKATSEDGVTTMTFSRGKKSKVAFTVTSSDSASTNPPPLTEAKACKGTQKFKKASKIGSFKIGKGSYRIALVNTKEFKCGEAARAFKKFRKSGKLPGSWKLVKSSATFTKKSNRKAGFFLTKNVAGT